MAYHIYVGESGDEGDYLDSNEKPITGISRYFVLAGIIVDENISQICNRNQDQYRYILVKLL